MPERREGRKREILVTRASLPPFEEYEAMLRGLWETHWLTNMGPYHEELRRRLLAYLQVSGIELFVNGHIALEMALQAFSLSGEVITTPFTFASTTHAIVRNGLVPVMCDVKETDGTLDPACIERLITKKTTAIVPVHVYGHICDAEAINEIAKAHGLKVIYDAAHAFGERILSGTGKEGDDSGAACNAPAEIGVGSLGDASMFSFHATKAFNTIEGGAVCWNKPSSRFLEERLYQLKNFGILDKEHVAFVGGNGKMNEFAAAMGLCNLNHVDEWIAARREIYARYEKNLHGVPGLHLLEKSEHVRYNYAYMPLVIEAGGKKRDAVYEALCDEGIYPRKYFYPCVNEYDCYRNPGFAGDTPVAKRLSESVLTLPIYPELTLSDVDEICERTEAACRG